MRKNPTVKGDIFMPGPVQPFVEQPDAEGLGPIKVDMTKNDGDQKDVACPTLGNSTDPRHFEGGPRNHPTPGKLGA